MHMIRKRPTRKIKCERCGLYCEQPYTYPYEARVSFLEYLKFYVDVRVDPRVVARRENRHY
jgi:hypothetical protein